jgi:hypothetical protein
MVASERALIDALVAMTTKSVRLQTWGGQRPRPVDGDFARRRPLPSDRLLPVPPRAALGDNTTTEDEEEGEPPTPQEQRIEEIRMQHRADLETLWTTPRVYAALTRACIISIFNALLAGVMMLLCFLPTIGQPILPLLGVIPSYGAIYAVPHLAGALIDIGATSMESVPAQVLVLLYNLATLGLDLFSIGMLVAWIYYYYAGSLSVANSNNQSIAMALFDVALTALMMLLGVLVCIDYSKAIDTVSRGQRALRRQWKAKQEDVDAPDDSVATTDNPDWASQ